MKIIKPKIVFFHQHLKLLLILFTFLFFSTNVFSQDVCNISGQIEVCSNAPINIYDYELDVDFQPGYVTEWIVAGGNIQSQSNSNISILWSFFANQYLIQAMVKDADGVLISTCLLNINYNRGPQAGFEPTTIKSVCVGTSFSFNSLADCDDCSYSWESTGAAVEIEHPNSSATDITFIEAGSTVINLITTDNITGCQTTRPCGYTIYNLFPPSFEVFEVDDNNGLLTTCVNQSLLFENTSPLFAADATIVPLLVWEITNGTNTWTYYDQEFINFLFTSPGTYTATLTTYLPGLDNCQESTSEIITVLDSPPIEVNCPSAVCEGETVTYSVDIACGSYNWNLSEEGTIINNNGSSIDVVWSSPNGSSEAYISFEGESCEGDYCSAPSVYTVPIFSTSAQIKGPDISCGNSAPIYCLPNFPGAVFNWDYEIVSTSTPDGTIQEIALTTPYRYRLLLNNFTGTIRISGSAFNPILGCYIEDVHETEVINNEIVQPADICLGESIALSLETPTNAPSKWELYKDNQLIYEETTIDEITIPATILNSPGIYTVDVYIFGSNGNSCRRIKNFSVLSTSNFTNISGPLEVCLGQPYIYQVNPGTNEVVTWVVSQNGIDESYTSDAISVVWTDPDGPRTISIMSELMGSPNCASGASSFQIDLLPDEEVSIIGHSQPCPDGSEIYTATSAGAIDYHWDIDPLYGSIIDGQGTSQILVQWLFVDALTATNLTLQTTLCSGQSIVDLPIELSPFELELFTNNICEGEESNFTSNATGGDNLQWYINNEAVPAPQGTNSVLNHTFTTPGDYTIRLDALNPNGCPGNFSALEEITVLLNPLPVISPVEALPCPEGTPFTRTLTVTPFSNDYDYVWFFNGTELSNNSPELIIDQPGAYQVQVSNTNCTNLSTPIQIRYNCEEECDCEPDPTSAFDLQITENYGAECGNIYFTGLIEPFENAINPTWQIIKPGLETSTITIFNQSDLTQLNYLIDTPGKYYVNLIAGFQCNQSPKTCYVSDVVEINVPFIVDFMNSIECNQVEGNYYHINLSDASLYYENPELVSYNWTVTGTSLSGNNNVFTVENVAPETSVEICLEVESGTLPFNCQVCKTITTPGNPDVSFMHDEMGLCTDQGIHFYPNLPIDQILELEWDFGDGSKSRLFEVTKVFETEGTYDVSLSITTIYGCQTTIYESIEIVNNILTGEIVESMMECSATANLEFNQTSGSPISNYSWSPNGETSSSITALESDVYSLTVSDEIGCEFSPPPFVVLLSDPFPVGINGKFESCDFLSLSVPNASGSYDYQWEMSPDPYGDTPSIGSSLIVTSLEAGTYSVTVTALGPNGTACAEQVEEVIIFGYPDTPELVSESISCSPSAVQLEVTNFDEVTWVGIGIPPSTNSSSIVVSSSGTYGANYVDENGCLSNATITVNDQVDFSSFLNGCYSYCRDIFLANPPTLFGIAGDFVEWEWRLVDETGSFVLLDSGTGTISDLQLTTQMVGSITLWVNDGFCTEESLPFNLSFEDCPEIECESFYSERICSTCGCGDLMGGVEIFDSNGNSVDATVHLVTWEINGVPYNNGNSTNPLLLVYNEPSVFTAYIEYFNLDGSTACLDTISTEVYCHGDCPSFQLGTCLDVDGNAYPDCDGIKDSDICNGYGTYAFLLDGAGNPIEDFFIDWYVDMVIDPNPYFLWNFGSCEPTPVHVWNYQGCDTTLYLEADCCSLSPPNVQCSDGGKFQIMWDPVCGTEFYEIDMVCANGNAIFPPVIVTEPNEAGYFVYDVPVNEACSFIGLRVRGYCSSGGYGEWFSCLGLEVNAGCFPCTGEFCDFIFGDGDGGGGFFGLTGTFSGFDNISKNGDFDNQLKTDFQLFPNPVNGNDIFLGLDKSILSLHSDIQIEIYDRNGKIINRSSYSTETRKIKIDVSDLVPGVYLLLVTNESGEQLYSEQFVRTK